MDPASRAAALSRYWDARGTSAPIPAPDAALAAMIAALEAAALAQPAPDFVAALERRLDLAAPRLPPAEVTSGVAPDVAPPHRRLSPVPPRPVNRRRALVAWGRVEPLLAVAAVLALAVVGVLATLVMDGARPGPEPDLQMAAAPPAYPDFSGARPAFLRIPRWEAELSVVPVDLESAIEVMWLNQDGTVLAGWDFTSAVPDTVGETVITLPSALSADTFASGDEVEIITSEFIVYRYRLADPESRETEAGNVLAGVADGVDSNGSLVLIGPEPFVETADQVPSRRIVVHGQLVGSSSLPVLAQPPATNCAGTARTIASLDSVVDILETRSERGTPSPDTIEIGGGGEPMGDPAGAETVAAVIAAETQLVACLNANDALRAYGHFTDVGIASLFNFVFGDLIRSEFGFDPDFTELTMPATPVPDAFQLALIDVSDVVVLPDNRIRAMVWVGFSDPIRRPMDEQPRSTETPYYNGSNVVMMVIAPTLQILSPQPDGTYLIDAIRYAPSAPALELDAAADS